MLSANKYMLSSRIGFLFYGPLTCGKIDHILPDSDNADVDHVYINTETGMKDVCFPSTKTANIRPGQFVAVRSMRIGPLFRGIYGIGRNNADGNNGSSDN